MKRRAIFRLNDTEIEALKGATENLQDQYLIYILLYTGMRIGELQHLKPSWINIREKTITIPEEDNGWSPKTSGKGLSKHCSARTVGVLNEDAVTILSTFTSFNMDRFQARRRLQYLAKKAGLDAWQISPHQLRHTHLSLMASKGFSVVALQEQAGHANPELVIEKYVHGSGREVKNERKRIGNI